MVLLALCTFSLVACFGKSAPVDPVTDSTYYQQKLTQLANDIAKKAAHRPRKAAMMDFVNQNGKTSQFGKYLTAKFNEISVMNKLFQTPAEGEVSKTIKQLGLTYNGTLDSVSTKRLGEALGCDAIIVGTISDLQKGSDVDLVIKMIDTKSGNIISASSASFFRSKQVSAMLESF